MGPYFIGAPVRWLVVETVAVLAAYVSMTAGDHVGWVTVGGLAALVRWGWR